jgi:hypothetical protein
VPHGGEHPPVVHEKLDVDAWSVTKVALMLAGITMLAGAVTAGYLVLLSAYARRSDTTPPPLARHDPNRLPPEPRLQNRPTTDLETLRAEERRLLSTYGWVDETKGIVRIPIEEAMRRTVLEALSRQDTGAPSTPPTSPEASGPTGDPILPPAAPPEPSPSPKETPR